MAADVRLQLVDKDFWVQSLINNFIQTSPFQNFYSKLQKLDKTLKNRDWNFAKLYSEKCLNLPKLSHFPKLSTGCDECLLEEIFHKLSKTYKFVIVHGRTSRNFHWSRREVFKLEKYSKLIDREKNLKLSVGHDETQVCDETSTEKLPLRNFHKLSKLSNWLSQNFCRRNVWLLRILTRENVRTNFGRSQFGKL